MQSDVALDADGGQAALLRGEKLPTTSCPSSWRSFLAPPKPPQHVLKSQRSSPSGLRVGTMDEEEKVLAVHIPSSS